MTGSLGAGIDDESLREARVEVGFSVVAGEGGRGAAEPALGASDDGVGWAGGRLGVPAAVFVPLWEA